MIKLVQIFIFILYSTIIDAQIPKGFYETNKFDTIQILMLVSDTCNIKVNDPFIIECVTGFIVKQKFEFRGERTPFYGSIAEYIELYDDRWNTIDFLDKDKKSFIDCINIWDSTKK